MGGRGRSRSCAVASVRTLPKKLTGWLLFTPMPPLQGGPSDHSNWSAAPLLPLTAHSVCFSFIVFLPLWTYPIYLFTCFLSMSFHQNVSPAWAGWCLFCSRCNGQGLPQSTIQQIFFQWMKSVPTLPSAPLVKFTNCLISGSLHLLSLIHEHQGLQSGLPAFSITPFNPSARVATL